jgi:hypothetical protein
MNFSPSADYMHAYIRIVDRNSLPPEIHLIIYPSLLSKVAEADFASQSSAFYPACVCSVRAHGRKTRRRREEPFILTFSSAELRLIPLDVLALSVTANAADVQSHLVPRIGAKLTCSCGE